MSARKTFTGWSLALAFVYLGSYSNASDEYSVVEQPANYEGMTEVYQYATSAKTPMSTDESHQDHDSYDNSKVFGNAAGWPKIFRKWKLNAVMAAPGKE